MIGRKKNPLEDKLKALQKELKKAKDEFEGAKQYGARLDDQIRDWDEQIKDWKGRAEAAKKVGADDLTAEALATAEKKDASSQQDRSEREKVRELLNATRFLVKSSSAEIKLWNSHRDLLLEASEKATVFQGHIETIKKLRHDCSEAKKTLIQAFGELEQESASLLAKLRARR